MYHLHVKKDLHGIPVLTGEALEQIVDNLLQSHGMDSVKTPSPLDVDTFAQNHLGIRQGFFDLSRNGEYDGAYVLRDYARIPAYDPAHHCDRCMSVAAGTMVLESALLKKETAYRHAVAHFCAHAVLHRDIVLHREQSRIPNLASPFFLCRNVISITDRDDPAEQQATRFALALLMPRQAVYILTAGMNVYDERSAPFIIHRMMDVFQVSRPAAACRLRMLLAGDGTAR